jgi:DNA-binding NarL/FixJ family response regulator
MKIVTRILLVDDYSAVRCGLRTLLENRLDWEVIGEAEDGEKGLEQAQRFHPDIAVVDVSMPKRNGLVRTREIRRLLPNTEVLIVTEHDSRPMLREAQEAGARGYIVKSHVAAYLLAAVEALSQHRAFFTPESER